MTLHFVSFRDLCENEPGAELGLQEGTIFQSVYDSFAEILKVNNAYNKTWSAGH